MHPGRTSVFALLIAVILNGCNTDEKAQSATTAQPPEVMVAQVVTREVTDYGEFTGRTNSSETVDIRSRVNGYLDTIDFTDGEEVKKGALLFQIDPRPFKADLENANGQKAQWVAKLARAESDVKRYEGLVPTGAASAQDLDKARADRGESAAAIQSSEAVIDRAKLDLEFSKITAPLNGQIGRNLISKGNLIRADSDILATIVALDPMFVYFDVDERALLRFRDQAASESPAGLKQDVRELKVPVYVGLANEEGYPHQGVINFADNKVDASTGTIRVRGTFDNSKRAFKPGLFTRVRVPMSKPFNAALVIDRAIATDQGQKFVYVVDEKNLAQYRVIKMGRLEDDGLRVITSGLKPGDSVIVTGLQRARPGKPVTPQRVEMPRSGAQAESQPTATEPGKTNATHASGQH